MKSPYLLVCVIALVQSSIAAPVYTFPQGKGGIFIEPSFSAVEGNKFEVGASNLTVTRLAYEYQREGQLAAETALFDATSGDVLASASISSADALSDGYFWKSITPITLQAGRQYYIGSIHQAGPGSEYWWNTREASLGASVVDMGTWFKVSSSIEGGSWEYGGGQSQYGPGEIRHYIGNFDATPLPEPASCLALLLGCLLARRRRAIPK